MMTLEAAIQLIKELGVTVSVLAYFIYRDYKMQKNLYFPHYQVLLHL